MTQAETRSLIGVMVKVLVEDIDSRGPDAAIKIMTG